MIRALAASALLLGCQPALAAVYGPPEPVEYVAPPDGTRWLTEDMIAAREDDTRSAWKRFWVGQGLVAADLALTCAILADGGRELNPIYGKGASCGKIIGIRAGVSLLQYFIARNAIRKDPTSAKKTLGWTLVLQGVPVVWNATQLAK